MIPERYKDLYYLRDIDLHAERLADYPLAMGETQCDTFRRAGLIFDTREEAENARRIMLDAYFKTSSTSLPIRIPSSSRLSHAH